MFTPPLGNCNKWHSMMVYFCKRPGLLRTCSSRSSSSSFFSLVNYVTFFKRHIIFEFFTQNPPKSGWWNWWFCLQRLLKSRVYVLYHASHSPKVLWKCAKSFIGFFNFWIFNKIINRVYLNCKSSKGHKIRPNEPIWSWGCLFLDPDLPLNP